MAGLIKDPYANSSPAQSSIASNPIYNRTYYAGGPVTGGNGPTFKSYTGQNMGTGSSDPYAYGLPTSFQSYYDLQPGEIYKDYSHSSDKDVRDAQWLMNDMAQGRLGLNAAVSQATDQASLAKVMARINLKNQLGSSIASNASDLNSAQNNVRANANAALDSGVKNTRNNYNSRGLLYSGMRQGGEQQVRGAVAGQEANDLANQNREYSDLLNKEKQAYSSVDLDTQQQNLSLANDAFNTVNQNNIARAQAYQQLGQGVGYAGGLLYGAYNSPSSEGGAGTGGYSDSLLNPGRSPQPRISGGPY